MKLYEVEKYKLFRISYKLFLHHLKQTLFLLDDEHNHHKNLYCYKKKILLNLLCTPLKLNKPFLILKVEIPTVNATAAAPTEFLILWIPSKRNSNFFNNQLFLFGKLTSKSNSENFMFCLIFLIKKFDLELIP